LENNINSNNFLEVLIAGVKLTPRDMSVNIKVTGGLNIEWGQIDPKVTGGLRATTDGF